MTKKTEARTGQENEERNGELDLFIRLIISNVAKLIGHSRLD